MKWRGYARLGFGALVALSFALSAPTAFGATLGWEFETPAYDFGAVAVGSHALQQLVVTNTGDEPIEGSGNWRLRWYSTLDEGSGLLKVASDSCSIFLEPGDSCSVGVSFNPTVLGHREGELEVFARSAGVAAASIELEGDGVAALPVIGPKLLVFGAVQAGGAPSPPQTVTLKNTGNLGLTIGGMSFTDPAGTPQEHGPFQIVGGSCQVGGVVAISGGSCTIEVVLAPSQAGSFQSRLVISDNASGPPQSIELQGTGTPAPSSSVHLAHHPAAVTRRLRATFRFITSPPGASTECNLDHHGFKPCASPKHYAALSQGRHDFRVRLLPVSGASNLASAGFHWRIRTRP